MTVQAWCSDSKATGRCCHRGQHGVCGEEPDYIVVFLNTGDPNTHVRCEAHTEAARSVPYEVEDPQHYVMLAPNDYLLAFPTKKAAVKAATTAKRDCKVLDEEMAVIRHYRADGVRVTKKGVPR